MGGTSSGLFSLAGSTFSPCSEVILIGMIRLKQVHN